MFDKKIFSLVVILSLLVPFGVASSQAATDFDLAITNVTKVSCKQPLSILDNKVTKEFTIYKEITVNGEKSELVATSFPSLEDYFSGKWTIGGSTIKQFEQDDNSYKLLSVAPDFSEYRYTLKYKDSQWIYRNVCVKVDINVSGDLTQFKTVEETNTPKTGMDQFFDFTKNNGFRTAAVISPAEKSEDIAYISTVGGKQIFPKYLEQGKNTFYEEIGFRESDNDPGGNLNLTYAVNNTFNSKIFERTFWNGVRHYNAGPSIQETTMTNNYFEGKNFLTTGTDYPAKPDVKILEKKGNVLEVSWQPTGLNDTYKVQHFRADFEKIQFDTTLTDTVQKETTFSMPLAGSSKYYDSVVVTAINSQGIIGPASNEVGYGSLFSDVDPGIWYGKYANNAYQSGIIQGYVDGKTGKALGIFGPGDKITKGQALKMASMNSNRLIRQSEFGFPLPYSIPQKFDNHWAKEYILSASILNFDLVKDIGNFNPDEAITRGELMHLLAQAYDAKPKNYGAYTFTDIGQSPYKNDIQFFNDLGVVSGYDNTTNFGPSNPLLRAEAVKIFVKTGKAFELSWPEQFQN